MKLSQILLRLGQLPARGPFGDVQHFPDLAVAIAFYFVQGKDHLLLCRQFTDYVQQLVQLQIIGILHGHFIFYPLGLLHFRRKLEETASDIAQARVDGNAFAPTFERAFSRKGTDVLEDFDKRLLNEVFRFLAIARIAQTDVKKFGSKQVIQFFLRLPLLLFAALYDQFDVSHQSQVVSHKSQY